MIGEREATRVTMRHPSMATTLHIIGSVEDVLRSTCSWNPGAPTDAGHIYEVAVPDGAMRFGLGAGAFGVPADDAVELLGECALLEGKPCWTPATPDATARAEPHNSSLLTPFLFEWDELDSVWAWRESTTGIALDQWYEYLLSYLEEAGVCETGAIAIEIVAHVPAHQIVDKRLRRAPLVKNRPVDGQLITHASHIDEFFLRNAVRAGMSKLAVPLDTTCLVIMVGVAIHPAMVARRWGPDTIALRRGFYATPGITSRAAAIHHTHALVVLNSWPTTTDQELLRRSPEVNVSEAAQLMTEWAVKQDTMHLVHLENDTEVHRAIARIGIIRNIRYGSAGGPITGAKLQEGR